MNKWKEKYEELRLTHKTRDILILAIESSCDETSVAVVKNGREVLSNIVSSQIEIHKRFGGVVPEVASRNHIMAIDNVVKEALESAKVDIRDIFISNITEQYMEIMQDIESIDVMRKTAEA